MCAGDEVETLFLQMRMQGSVLMVFLLSPLFACEESQLRRNEKGVSLLSGWVGAVFPGMNKHTFHSMKMISDRSSKPPMTLPIRIQSEMGMARPLRTSSAVWARRKTGQYKNKWRSIPASYTPTAVFLPPSRLFLYPE